MSEPTAPPQGPGAPEPEGDSRPAGYRMSFEPSPRRLRVEFGGQTLADSRRALVLHETRLPPVYYLPREDVRMDLLEPSDYRTHCPFKGNASYWTLVVGEARAEHAAWSYEDPLPEAEPIRGHLAFYRNRVDAWHEEDTPVCLGGGPADVGEANPLVDWLLRDAWEATSTSELLARLARQLSASGVPVMRMNLLVRTLHPQVMGAGHVWSRERDAVETFEIPHRRDDEEIFLSSPFVPIFEGRGGIRRRLDAPDARLDFPILRELAQRGATDYVAMPLSFSDGRIHALTLASDAPGGFTTGHLGQLYEVLPLVSRLVEVHALHHRARTLLDTYLGSHTGGRVLEGRIRRGDGQDIRAVLWWADLRGSTGLAEALPRAEYLALLNRFFDCTAGAVIEQGGEVLKFVGDAVMAIFPSGEGPEAGRRALRAAREALRRVALLSAAHAGAGGPGLALALHHGDVSYGNVGVAQRLDFTVTGPAVNEVARLEGLAKALGLPVVASKPFAGLVPGELVPLGPHALRGVAGTHEVFTLPDAR